MKTTTQSKSPRYHGLDALRAWAMSMGIVLHAAWLLIPGEAGAPATDASANSFCEYLCLSIHTFRMQLFFVLAGFFACMLVRKRGTGKFIKNRTLRIGLPLLVSWLVLGPIMMWQFHTAGLDSGAIQSSLSAWELTSGYFRNLKPDSTMLLHLWFLYYLSLVYAIVIVARLAFGIFDNQGNVREAISTQVIGLLNRPWGVFAIAFFFAPLICMMSGVWGIEVGLDTLSPKLPGLVSYSLYFVIGWLIYRNVGMLNSLTRGWRWQLALGLLLTIPYFFFAKVAPKHGYATWGYPKLLSNTFDTITNSNDIPTQNCVPALVSAEEGTIAHMVWDRIPEENRQFLQRRDQATENQLAGLLSALNASVLIDSGFAVAASAFAEIGRAVDGLSQTETMTLNRTILESEFAGLIHSKDSGQPYYHVVRATYSYVYSLTSWLLIMGCIGFFNTHCNFNSRFWRYFSDSSYWMYLAHLPIQFSDSSLGWSGTLGRADEVPCLCFRKPRGTRPNVSLFGASDVDRLVAQCRMVSIRSNRLNRNERGLRTPSAATAPMSSLIEGKTGGRNARRWKAPAANWRLPRKHRLHQPLAL